MAVGGDLHLLIYKYGCHDMNIYIILYTYTFRKQNKLFVIIINDSFLIVVAVRFSQYPLPTIVFIFIS